MNGQLHLPPGWGVAELRSDRGRAHVDDRAARSYDHHGTVLVWYPGPSCLGATATACDLEHATRFADPVHVPGGPEAGVGLDSWVATEVVAKLTDQPVLAFLRAHGAIRSLPVPPAELALAPFGARGTVQIAVVRSTDGARGAAFGMRRPPGRAR
jgi:hypothetical protein